MESLKKYLGAVWIATGLIVGYFNVIIMGLPNLKSGKQEDLVFAIINLSILTPIIVGGLIIFGYYALRNEFKKMDKS
jgi:hypothetical protein